MYKFYFLSRVKRGETIFLSYKRIFARNQKQAEKLYIKFLNLRYDEYKPISIRKKRLPFFYYLSNVTMVMFLMLIASFIIYYNITVNTNIVYKQ